MAWYNFLSGIFRQDKQDSQKFYCANPQCRELIEDEKMAYEPAQKQVVHGGDCQSMLIAHRVMKTRTMMTGNFNIITQEQANKLAREGKISGDCLENKVGNTD